MKRLVAILLLGSTCALLSGSPPENAPDATVSAPAGDVRFTWVDAYIDPRGEPLAAYQFELKATGAGVTLIGVEGGEHPAYAQPPYYDPRANLQNRIVIAAFNAGDDLPRHKTRVARIMLRVSGGNPIFTTQLQLAASIEGKRIEAEIHIIEGAAQ